MNRISKAVRIVVCAEIAFFVLLPLGKADAASDNGSKLLDLAMKKFGTLTEAEGILFRKVVNGELADCSDNVERNNDPNDAAQWDKETRVIRAQCIEWLCTDPEASAMLTHKGIWVKGARIEGRLDLSFLRIAFPLRFTNSAVQNGISLLYAEISLLDLEGTYTGPITADGLKVNGTVLLCNGFKAEGEVSLYGATIDIDLDCSKGQFSDPNGYALNARMVRVGGDVNLGNNFRAEGEVCLKNATIGCGLHCEKGEFINPGKAALQADGIDVRGSVFFRNGFRAEGSVDLTAAIVGLYFILADVDSPEKMSLGLWSAKVGTLQDEAKSWPHKDNLYLHGLVYDTIHDNAPRDAKSRIEWLRRQPLFRPQPYEQLAAVLRKSGQDEDAREVLIAKNEDRAHLAKLTTLSEKCWYTALGPTIGYGYRPLNALWGVAAFVVLGWFLFGIGYLSGLVTPESESAYIGRSIGPADDGVPLRNLSGLYPRFNFLIYSIDAFVPLIDLHQAKYWLPNAGRGLKLVNIKGFSLRIGGLLRLYLWIHLTVGWILTTLLVVGLTGLIRT